MKNKFMCRVLVTLLAITFSILNVNASTATKNIDKSACEKVYTNYYFLLDANTTFFFDDSNLSNISHTNIGEYYNNSYQVKFDSSNVGYGQVKINNSTNTSSDGITSMSLDDYYTKYLKAINRDGTYTSGTVNYIVLHNFYSVDASGNWTQGGKGLDLRNYSKSELINATLNANSTITRYSKISYNEENPFQLRIDRDYYGYLTGLPIFYESYWYYLHPAVYYIQYCSPKEEGEYTVHYDGNGDNVSNVPKDDVTSEDECTTISKIEPKRDGYEFLGWSRDKDATEPDSRYAKGEEYCGEYGDITLYAIWKKVEEATYYTIEYRPNTTDQVSNMPSNVTINSNEDAVISSLIPVRVGYTFLGWSTDSNAQTGNDSFKGGSLYTDRKDLVLYAVWKKNETLPDNPQTGITDYLLPFGGTLAGAGTCLSVLKKKKTFKQF